MNDLKTLDKTYIANTYARFPVEIVSGHGSVLTDADGKVYIDMGSGIAVNSFGIGDPVWKQAVTAQLDLVQHTSNLYYTEPCVKLAKLLCEKTGMKKVFFGNSGAEANECAIKAARKYAAEKKGPEYSTILTLWTPIWRPLWESIILPKTTAASSAVSQRKTAMNCWKDRRKS